MGSLAEQTQMDLKEGFLSCSTKRKTIKKSITPFWMERRKKNCNNGSILMMKELSRFEIFFFCILREILFHMQTKKISNQSLDSRLSLFLFYFKLNRYFSEEIE